MRTPHDAAVRRRGRLGTGVTFVALMQCERASHPNIRLDRLYAVCVILEATAILRCTWNFCRGLRGGPGARSSPGAIAP